MKYIMSVLLFAGLIYSGNPKLVVKPMVIDDGRLLPCAGHGSRDGYIVDESINQYTLVGIHHECIAYNAVADAIGIVNRSTSSILNFHSTNGALSFWIDDLAIYGGDFGVARYPMAIALDDAPYASFTCVSGGPSSAAAVYGSGGWFSSTWNPAVDLGGTNIQACIGKELPNGNLCFILYGNSPFQLYYLTYTPNLGTLLDFDTLSAPGTYYWGWDSNKNGGIAYVFYCDDNLNVYYRTSTDGITWTAEQAYNMVWPNPYTNNLISLFTGLQAVVTDSGNPVLVFDMRNGDDPTYPPYSKVYVSTASGQPCTKVSSEFGALDTESYYVGITTGGNSIGVIYCMPRNNLDNSLTWLDIYYNQSDDNGATWHGPVNQTADHTRRSCIPQVAKRFDTARNRAYVIFGQARDTLQEMDLMWAYDNSISLPIYICFQTVHVGVEEHKTEMPQKLIINVTPNPVVKNSRISYTLPAAGNVSLRLYSIDGRLIKTLDQGYKTSGIHAVNVRNLAKGLYFIRLETLSGSASRSMVFLK